MDLVIAALRSRCGHYIFALWFLANVNSRSRYMLSPVRLSSVTFVRRGLRPTQAVLIFRNISPALGTLAIRCHPLKISRRSSQENPSAGGVKHKRDLSTANLGNGAR